VNRRNQICAVATVPTPSSRHQMTSMRCKHPGRYIPNPCHARDIRRRGLARPWILEFAILPSSKRVILRQSPGKRQQIPFVAHDRGTPLAAQGFRAHHADLCKAGVPLQTSFGNQRQHRRIDCPWRSRARLRSRPRHRTRRAWRPAYRFPLASLQCVLGHSSRVIGAGVAHLQEGLANRGIFRDRTVEAILLEHMTGKGAELPTRSTMQSWPALQLLLHESPAFPRAVLRRRPPAR